MSTGNQSESSSFSVRVNQTRQRGLEAAREAIGGYLQQKQIAELKQKYANFNSLKASEKVEAVKDTSLNPFLFEDTSDGLANSMWRWRTEAPAFASKSTQEKEAVASRYYDEVLKPLYEHGGAAPLSKENWLRNAWGTALTYDTKQTYRAPLLKGILEGMDSAISEVANVGRTLANIGRMPIVGYADSVKRGDLTGLTGFYNLYVNMHNRVAKEGLATGVAKTIEETGEKNVLGFGSSKWLHDIASSEEFWKTVSPEKTFTEKAASFTVENAMLLPLFDGIGEANKLGIGLVKDAGEGVPYMENLTKVLQASKSGRMAAKMLTHGTEGLIYGDLTRDTDDKHNAWKDALQFAAFGTLFSYAGSGAKKLSELLPEGVERDAVLAAEKRADLGRIGKREATPEEYLQAYREHLASVMAAGGRPAVHSILETALAHVALDEDPNLSEMDKLKFRQDKMDIDPVGWKSVFASMTIIKRFLKEQGWKLSEMNNARWADLEGHLNGQVDKAAEEIDLHVPEIQEMKAQSLVEGYMKTPEGKVEYQQELQKATEMLKGHPDAEKKAQILAENVIMKRRIKAIEKAAEVRTVTGPENVRANQTAPEGVGLLPSSLRGSKPKYNYGTGNSFDLNFDDPRDLAAYVLGNKGKSAAHEDFAAYYKSQYPNATQSQIEAHSARVREAIKQQAKNWDGEGKRILRINSTEPKKVTSPDPAIARRVVKSRYERDAKGKITGYTLSLSHDWKVAKEDLAKAKGGKNTTKFWKDYIETLTGKNDDDVLGAQALAEDLRDYFNPTKKYGLQFEKSSSEGGDWTNFLGYMYSHKDKLPEPVQERLEEILMNSPKMRELLGARPTIKKLETFAQAMQNHVDIFLRSDWYAKKGERNIFRSSTPGISGPESLSKWQADKKLVLSSHKNDLAWASEFYPGRSAAMQEARAQYIAALQTLQAQELAAYEKGNHAKVAKIMQQVKAKIEAAAAGEDVE